MSNTEQENKEILQKVETSLFHIHSLADILEDAFCSKDTIERINTVNNFSTPFNSIAQIIKEKAEFCLTEIENVE